MRRIILFGILIIFSNCIFPQIQDITRLPNQNSNQSITKSASVMLSENAIMVFYANEELDTIFVTKSNDGGISWNNPEVIQVIGTPQPLNVFDLVALRTLNERILVAWSVVLEGMKVIYSDNKGESWSGPIQISGDINSSNKNNCTWLNLFQLITGNLILSFNQYYTIGSINSKIYYKVSTDNGFSWSENPFVFPYLGNYLSFYTKDDQNILAVFQGDFSSNTGIYKAKSTDGGYSWSNKEEIGNSEYPETIPRLAADMNDKLWLVFQRKYTTKINNYHQQDLIFLTTTDEGQTWSNEQRFTKYAGNDWFPNLSKFDNKIFLTFSTQRFFNKDQIAFGFLGETVEKYTPPYVVSAYTPYYGADLEDRTFVINAMIIDDDSIASVTVFYDDSSAAGELFDDGMHSDGEANDNFYSNALPLTSEATANAYILKTNKISFLLDNTGGLASAVSHILLPVSIKSKDINDNESSFLDSLYIYYEEPHAQFENGIFLYSAGFFLSGITNGQVWANGIEYSTLINDYLPGVVNSDPDNSINKIYSVKKDDIPFGASWQQWKGAVELGAKFYDGNGDGIYKPVDKNYNGIWDKNEDMPFILGDETVYCVYNDGMPANLRRWNSQPQGIEIRQTMFVSNLNDFQNVVFINYSINNTGFISNIIDSVYFGFFSDPDIGNASNDITGCDTLLNSIFAYSDTTQEIPFWPDDIPPALFTTLLQGPIVQTNNNSDTAAVKEGILLGEQRFVAAKNLNISASISFVGGDPQIIDPNTIQKVRNYLKGLNAFGDRIDPCNWLYGQVMGGVNCNDINPLFWYSGDPVLKNGWICKLKTDARSLLSVGPFQLEKDKPQNITAAFVLGRGSDNINSIAAARHIVSEVIQEYKSNFSSLTYQPGNQVYPVVSYELYNNYPNPFNPTTTIRYELPKDGVVTIDIFNILGQKVKTLLNEFKKADRYEVVFNAKGLASGVYIYRMRVNDFTECRKMLLIK